MKEKGFKASTRQSSTLWNVISLYYLKFGRKLYFSQSDS